MTPRLTRHALLTALGPTDATWAGVLAGRTGLSLEEAGPWAGVPLGRVAAALPRGPRTTGLALAAVQALGPVPGRRTAVVGATTTSGMGEAEPDIAAWLREGVLDDPTRFLWGSTPHRPAEAVRALLGADGPALTVSTACTSGAAAFGVAKDLLEGGAADRVVVVGADALCDTTVFGFRSLGAMSRTRCRPMDEGRDGMALGEAGAAVLVEPADTGVELLGVATATDAWHLTAPEPDGRGLEAAIRSALGALSPSEVDHVNAHATATRANDEVEAAVLARVLPQAAVSATKGATGHTLGAAGVVEVILLLRSLVAGVVPPVAGLERPLPGVGAAATARAVRQRVGVSVNLAFGGHNAAVALRWAP